jgi:hypothetical protein
MQHLLEQAAGAVRPVKSVYPVISAPYRNHFAGTAFAK